MTLDEIYEKLQEEKKKRREEEIQEIEERNGKWEKFSERVSFLDSMYSQAQSSAGGIGSILLGWIFGNGNFWNDNGVWNDNQSWQD